MRTLLILTILLLSATVYAQGLVKVVEPVRVSLSDDAESTPVDKAFSELLRQELGSRGNVALTSARFDYKVQTAVVAITAKGKPAGFSGAIAVMSQAAGSKEVNLKLFVTVAPTLDALATDASVFLNKVLKAREKR